MRLASPGLAACVVQDADSLDSETNTKKEGAFYLWYGSCVSDHVVPALPAQPHAVWQ
jgi:hypothetical protein